MIRFLKWVLGIKTNDCQHDWKLIEEIDKKDEDGDIYGKKYIYI